MRRGARIEANRPDYLYAVLPMKRDTVDLELLFAENDDTVAVRAAGRRPRDAGARKRLSDLLEGLKRELRWTDVPILRQARLIVSEERERVSSDSPLPAGTGGGGSSSWSPPGTSSGPRQEA